MAEAQLQLEAKAREADALAATMARLQLENKQLRSQLTKIRVRDRRCFACGVQGHLRRDCPSKKSKNNNNHVAQNGGPKTTPKPKSQPEPPQEAAQQKPTVPEDNDSNVAVDGDDHRDSHRSSTASEGNDSDGSSVASDLKRPTPTPEQQEARRHMCLSWTACYDDSCQVHLSEKQGSNWYPKPPRPLPTPASVCPGC